MSSRCIHGDELFYCCGNPDRTPEPAYPASGQEMAALAASLEYKKKSSDEILELLRDIKDLLWTIEMRGRKD